MKLVLRYILITSILFKGLNVYCQDQSLETVDGAYTHSQLINTQTTQMLPKKAIEFRIQHRFGQIGMDESLYKEFLGIDLPANIRFAVNYAISDNLYVGVGRSKNNKTWDFEGKYAFFKQTRSNSMPVSVALYFNTAISSADFPKLSDNAFFADSITPFAYTFSHRLSYNSQIIISKNWGNIFSYQLSPCIIYQNLVNPNRDNYTMVLPTSARLKIGIRTAIILEYAYIVNNRYENQIDPLALGFEVGTAGHVFQLLFCSSEYLLEQNIYTNNSNDYTEKKFLLGFNIKRTFWKKPPE